MDKSARSRRAGSSTNTNDVVGSSVLIGDHVPDTATEGTVLVNHRKPPHGDVRRDRTRGPLSSARRTAIVGLVVFASACGWGSGDDEASPGPQLDLDTLQAEDDLLGSLQAERLPDSYVGAVDEELFIGISLGQPDGDGSRSAEAYLCNGDDIGLWLQGELSDGAGTLGSVDDGATVQAVFDEDDGAVSGRADVVGHEAGFFTATSASGTAGLFRSVGADPGIDTNTDLPVDPATLTSAGWVVLDDGEQRGTLSDFFGCVGACIRSSINNKSICPGMCGDVMLN